ncbi:hypothetical protein HNY73_017947 [Argiope bruennichi]|uniref:Uncharacterized protein n=1 Tax=Argiope bruennichi TaxID=94029 RepID=A0A8T0ECF6_ARGBR|nr:hypothetical protein HNY73_017947 [Argiope bruennichi]
MKKRVSPEVKDHFLDVWCEWATPDDLIDKWDTYENLRPNKKETQISDLEGHKKQLDPQKTNHKRNFYSKGSRIQYERQSMSGILNHSRRDSGVPSQSKRDSTNADRAHVRSTDTHVEDSLAYMLW